MAGPREAYLQARMLDNLKMKNFIVGRDHAGYKNFFSPYVAALSHNIAQLLPKDLDISYFSNSGSEFLNCFT